VLDCIQAIVSLNIFGVDDMIDNKIKTSRIYLNEYVLQKDMRMRMPKEIIKNLNAIPGKSFFEIYLDSEQQEIILSIKNKIDLEA